jgi:D-glycero-D-manno-heptose 1,7-bisphosphate phosphatase
MHPAIFLDRDGVIIENREDYVRSWTDVRYIPHTLVDLAHLSQTAYKIIIVTNQSVIGRGLITHECAEQINRRLILEIEQAGGRVDGLYVCPHAPADGCSCRKPQPGLLLRAASELSIDLSASYMIGDALSDIQAGQAAGVRQAILVCTGRGSAQAALPEAVKLQPFLIYPTLQQALERILLKPTV